MCIEQCYPFYSLNEDVQETLGGGRTSRSIMVKKKRTQFSEGKNFQIVLNSQQKNREKSMAEELNQLKNGSSKKSSKNGTSQSKSLQEELEEAEEEEEEDDGVQNQQVSVIYMEGLDVNENEFNYDHNNFQNGTFQQDDHSFFTVGV